MHRHSYLFVSEAGKQDVIYVSANLVCFSRCFSPFMKYCSPDTGDSLCEKTCHDDIDGLGHLSRSRIGWVEAPFWYFNETFCWFILQRAPMSHGLRQARIQDLGTITTKESNPQPTSTTRARRPMLKFSYEAPVISVGSPERRFVFFSLRWASDSLYRESSWNCLLSFSCMLYKRHWSQC